MMTPASLGTFDRDEAMGFVQGPSLDRNRSTRDTFPVGEFTPVFILTPAARTADASEHWDFTESGWVRSSVLRGTAGDFGYGTLPSTFFPGGFPGLENWEEDRQNWTNTLIATDGADWRSVGAVRPLYRVFIVQPLYSNLANFDLDFAPGQLGLPSVHGWFVVTTPSLLKPQGLEPGIPASLLTYRTPTKPFTGFGEIEPSEGNPNPGAPPSTLAPGVINDLDAAITEPFYDDLARRMWLRMAGVLGTGGMQEEFLRNLDPPRPLIRPLYIFHDLQGSPFGAGSSTRMRASDRLRIQQELQRIIDPQGIRGLQFRGGTYGTGRWLSILAGTMSGRVPRP